MDKVKAVLKDIASAIKHFWEGLSPDSKAFLEGFALGIASTVTLCLFF